MKGGYTLIDCTGLDLTKGSTEQSISGIHGKVKAAMATGKMLIAENCNWNGAFVTPISVLAIDFGDCIIVTASTLQIVILPTNVITIRNLAPAADA